VVNKGAIFLAIITLNFRKCDDLINDELLQVAFACNGARDNLRRSADEVVNLIRVVLMVFMGKR
jgi:hypothetical protein